jgi:hypothetical protein
MLCRIKEFIFHRQSKDAILGVVFSYHQSMEKMKEATHCWKTNVENIDGDDHRDIQIKESKGEHALKGNVTKTVTLEYNGLIKTKKHNISIEEDPNMSIIGYYWDKETIT